MPRQDPSVKVMISLTQRNKMAELFKKYHILTYGCQMNKNDSERMAGLLENLGFEPSQTWQEANLVLLNTCSIRDKAERRVFGQLHELHHYRKTHSKDMELGVMGCMPQHAQAFIREKLPFVDYVVGVNNMEDLPNFLGHGYTLSQQLEQLRTRRTKKDVNRFEHKLAKQVRASGKKAWISIQFGCNKVCSFCIVPYTRGIEISREKEAIFKEIAALHEKNVTEIVLLGQNVNSYGMTIYDDYRFADLLRETATKFPWLEKIDFLTSYPSDVTQELIEVIASYPNITNEIHFPLQHGDDSILKAMRRRYTVAEYRLKVQQLRNRIPDVRLGTDLIVGFPGETEEHFLNMLAVLSEIRFDFANTAAYSPRPKTRAARLPHQVPDQIKRKRLHRLNEHLQAIYKTNDNNPHFTQTNPHLAQAR
ncbi:tRNA-2-methylthio-N(6)-dimethylallyladenosine synthase [Spirochaetota bacterium]|nr:tRNA-2-methylthio-N(6)-dimethylallyladenosine synthase [Spirochaetota bacterium]